MTSTRILAVCLIAAACSTAAAAQQPRTALLSGLTRDLACSVSSPPATPAMPALIVTAGRERGKTLFGTGDAVVIRGGTAQGVKTGDEFFVRRRVQDRFTEPAPGVYSVSISTAGAVQVVEAEAAFSIAVVTYGCEGIEEGDYLERYEPTVAPPAQAGAAPDYTQPGHLVLGSERRQIGSAGDFMVIDRGSDQGLRAGQRLTIFRHTIKDGPVANIGSATVYTVQPASSVVRIEGSLDAVYIGDLVAVHR
jgi:hypothetical protein